MRSCSCSLCAPQAPSSLVRSQAAAASAVSNPYLLSASQILPVTRPQGTSEGAPASSASLQQFPGSNPGASLQMGAAATSVLAHGTAPGADGAAGVVAPFAAGAEQEGVEVMPLTPVTGHMVRCAGSVAAACESLNMLTAGPVVRRCGGTAYQVRGERVPSPCTALHPLTAGCRQAKQCADLELLMHGRLPNCGNGLAGSVVTWDFWGRWW